MWSWFLASYRVSNRNYLSVRFIFRISEAILMVFGSWYKEPGSKYSTPLAFIARTELLALTGVGWFSSAKKRYRFKTRSSSVAVRNVCSRPFRARRYRTQFFHLLTGNWFLINNAGDVACCSNALFALVNVGSLRINGYYDGFYILMNFCKNATFLPRTREKTILFFWYFFSVLRKLVATRTSTPFCNLKVNIVVVT